MTTTTKESVLVYADTRKLVRPGDVVQVRNVSMKVVAIRPPRHEGSSGRVLVQCDGSNADENSEYEYYPSVIGAAWVPADTVRTDSAPTVQQPSRVGDMPVLVAEWEQVIESLPMDRVVEYRKALATLREWPEFAGSFKSTRIFDLIHLLDERMRKEVR